MKYKLFSIMVILSLLTIILLQAIEIRSLNELLANAQWTIEGLLITLGAISF